MRKLTVAIVAGLILPVTVLAETTTVVPATSDDLAAFDRAVERQQAAARSARPERAEGERSSAPVGPRRENFGAVVSQEAKKLRETEAKNGDFGKWVKERRRESRERNEEIGRTTERGEVDSRSTRESISGKRSGREDNPGKGDHGREVEGE